MSEWDDFRPDFLPARPVGRKATQPAKPEIPPTTLRAQIDQVTQHKLTTLELDNIMRCINDTEEDV